MLVDFTVENFRSIKEPVTLSMLANNTMDELPDNYFKLEREKNISLLKTAAIYGPNASGKTNVLKALSSLILYVFNSTDLKLNEDIPLYQPFLFDTNSKDKPVMFEIEFVNTNNIRYNYRIEFSRKEVVSEKLSFYPKNKEVLLFNRRKGERIKFGSQLKGKNRIIEEQLLSNQLFLSKAGNSNHEILTEIYKYFLGKLFFISKRNFIHLSESLTKVLIERKQKKIMELIRLLINYADPGINEILLKDNNDSIQLKFEKDVPDPLKEIISKDFMGIPNAEHTSFKNKIESGKVLIDLREESEGTIKMYVLAGYIIVSLWEGCTLLIDEIESSFHPLLSEFIFSLYNDPNTNPNNAQLIVATHDVTLLNPDLLRRDQIWFIEKNKYGVTSLYSLDEFDKDVVRKTTSFGKWYLTGRFGAVPVIFKSTFEQLIKEIIAEDENEEK